MNAQLLKDRANSDKVEYSVEFAARPQLDKFDIKDLSSAAVMCGPYHKPKSKQLEFVDGFYLRKMTPGSEVTPQDLVEWNAGNLLFMFQMTISKTHPVNASEIISVLEKLGLLEAVKKEPKRGALVFVTPEDIAGGCK